MNHERMPQIMKSLFFRSLAVVALLALPTLGEEIVTTTNQTYSNVSITRVEPDGLVVATEYGVEKIPFSILPAETQQKYRYDPEKASRHQTALQAAAQRRQADLQAQMQQAKARRYERADEQALEGAATQVQGKVLSTTAKGVLLTEVQVEVREVVPVEVSRNPLSGAPHYERRKVARMVQYKEPVFIYGVGGMVDGETFSARVYPAPNFGYRSLIGAEKQVRGFARSMEHAKQLNR